MSRVNCSSNCFFFVTSISERLLFDAPLIDHLFLPEWDEWNMWIVCRAVTNFSSSLQLNVLKDKYRRKKKNQNVLKQNIFCNCHRTDFTFGATIHCVCLWIYLCRRICVYQNCFFREHPSCPQLSPSYPGADHPSSLCIHFAHPLLPESTVCRSPQVFP